MLVLLYMAICKYEETECHLGSRNHFFQCSIFNYVFSPELQGKSSIFSLLIINKPHKYRVFKFHILSEFCMQNFLK